MVEINIDSSLKVNASKITDGTAGRIFYEKLDNTLGQVPGFSYDETTTSLSYQDSIRNLGFIIGETEVAPSISIPLLGFSASDGAAISWVDTTSVGGSRRVLIGYADVARLSIRLDDIIIGFPNNSNLKLEEDFASLEVSGTDNSFRATDVGLSLYGVTPVARQTISANPTNAEIATVLNNIGIAEIV